MYILYTLTLGLIGYCLVKPVTEFTAIGVEYYRYKYSTQENRVYNGNPYYHRIDYRYNNKLYTMLVPSRVLRSNIVQVTDQNDVDVTPRIRELLGPRENWHGDYLTPYLLGYGKLKFEFLQGSDKVFVDNQIIDLCDDISSSDGEENGEDKEETVGEDKEETVGEDKEETVGEDKEETVGEDKEETVGEDKEETVGESSIFSFFSN